MPQVPRARANRAPPRHAFRESSPSAARVPGTCHLDAEARGKRKDDALKPTPAAKTSFTPDQALARMKKGNADFLADKAEVLPRDHERRLAVALEQSPFAVLVGCSDSRVSPELLFGAGLGELFIVRNAGNTLNDVALGGVEFAALMLGTPLIVVLGHQRCGAVQAAIETVEKGATFPGSIDRMVELVIPAVEGTRAYRNSEGDTWLDAAIRENVRLIVERLRNDVPSLRDPQSTGQLRIVGAEYSLDEGKVDFFLE
ncbi:MAG: carbonic anhydrase [Myxococcales bacterium]|nr:carbonic anhydrase [Myxococcales bacterium]